MSEKYAHPSVPEQTINTVQDIILEKQPVYPWEILDTAVDKGLERKQARRVIRMLKLQHYLVPCGDFVGKVKLTEQKQ